MMFTKSHHDFNPSHYDSPTTQFPSPESDYVCTAVCACMHGLQYNCLHSSCRSLYARRTGSHRVCPSDALFPDHP